MPASLTWLTSGDSGDPAAVGMALGLLAALHRVARAAAEGDGGPRKVLSLLPFSHFSIPDAGAHAGDDWKQRAAKWGLWEQLPRPGLPPLFL